MQVTIHVDPGNNQTATTVYAIMWIGADMFKNSVRSFTSKEKAMEVARLMYDSYVTAGAVVRWA
jgi:hypothetical protein